MHTDTPLISIITPVFNGEKHIRECIESVLAQDYPCIEHIIIDDGSNDSTCIIISEYPHVTLIKKSRAGATAARNTGLHNANGQYIKFLDADDILAAGALVLQWAASSGLADGQIGYGYAEEFSASGDSRLIKRQNSQHCPSALIDLMFRNILISLPLYPAASLHAINGFDERLQSGQEWNLHIRLASHGYQFVFQDIFIFRYRQHNTEHRISNRKIDWVKELQNFEFSFEAIANSREPVVIDAWAAYLWGFGRRALREGNPEGATLFFDKARQLSASGFKQFLPWKYRIALLLLGAEKTERLISITNRATTGHSP
jgi:glycosyltransferase involved in cell wall biosynthesis